MLHTQELRLEDQCSGRELGEEIHTVRLVGGGRFDLGYLDSDAMDPLQDSLTFLSSYLREILSR